MSVHHKYSPSNYNAWAVCPDWTGIGRNTDEANEGTKAHEELHRALTEQDYEPDDETAKWAAGRIFELADGAHIDSEVRIEGSVGTLSGIYGTTDARWEKDGVMYYADFKKFSDGTIDYLPQLRGYAALGMKHTDMPDAKVVLVVLHGGIHKEEVVETTLGECASATLKILETVRAPIRECTLCKWCQYCSKMLTCPATNNALQTVSDNGVGFSRLSICQKLVVLDAVDKLSKTIRDEAKRLAQENGGVLEMDGIRYEMKPWAGKPKVKDLCEVASAIAEPKFVKYNDKKQEATELSWNGLNHEELLALCDVSKAKLADALVAKNPDAKKVDIKKYIDGFFEETEGTPHFVRTM